MRIVCQQPNYFPWLGYFEQVARADSFVYLDDVQWIRQGRQHRCRLPGPGEEKAWLTIPVLGHGHRERVIREMRIDQLQNWPRRHWETLRTLYGRAPFFRSQLEPLVRPFLERAGKLRFLRDACEGSVALLWEPLGLQATVWHSTDLGATSRKTERLLELCQSLEASEYYSALGASRYLDHSLFRAAGIRVRWQHFRASPLSPTRPCDLSVLDWLAHHDWNDLRRALGPERGSFGAFSGERAVDGVVPAVDGRVH